PPRHAPRPPDPADDLPQERHPDRRRRPPGRDRPVRDGSRLVRARRQLQGPRARQPVRRRHELLPEHRGGEPGAYGHGERHPGRRPPPGATWSVRRSPAGRRRCRRREPGLVARSPDRSPARDPADGVGQSASTRRELMSLEGKAAVVTGGDSGIGHAISLEMARQGAFVTINYHKNQTAADETVKAIEAEGGKGEAVQGDVSSVADIQRLIDSTVKATGRL